MHLATSAAAESDKRYEVIIDLTEQSYTLREITNPELSVVLEEEIITENDFSYNCRVDYVLFDDFIMGNESFANEGRAKFRAGQSGWQYGGVIVLIDESQQPYTVVVNRLNRTVKLEQGEIEPLVPRTESEMIF